MVDNKVLEISFGRESSLFSSFPLPITPNDDFASTSSSFSSSLNELHLKHWLILDDTSGLFVFMGGAGNGGLGETLEREELPHRGKHGKRFLNSMGVGEVDSSLAIFAEFALSHLKKHFLSGREISRLA